MSDEKPQDVQKQSTVDAQPILQKLGMQIGQLEVNLAIAQSEVEGLRKENEGLREELLARQNSAPKERNQRS